MKDMYLTATDPGRADPDPAAGWTPTASSPHGEAPAMPGLGTRFRNRSLVVAVSLGVIATAFVGLAPAASALPPCQGGSAYPPQMCQAAVSASRVLAGNRITVSGRYFLPRTTARVYLVRWGRSSYMASGRVARNNRVAVMFRIPARTGPGSATLVLRGIGRDGRSRTLAAGITVVRRSGSAAIPSLSSGGAISSGAGTTSGAAPAADTSQLDGSAGSGGRSDGADSAAAHTEDSAGSLADSGSNSLTVPIGVAGAGLLLAGGVALVVVRRRRSDVDATQAE
jgi:hypothetical protein